MTTDYYELLGVPQDATPEQIKKAYRRLARELHPDVTSGHADSKEKEARFKQVSVAYETLSDPDKRTRYDRFGPEGVAGGDPFSGMSVNDIFNMFFGGSPFGEPSGPSGPPRGADLEALVDLPFEDAVFGADVDVEVRTAVACEACDASGAEPGTSPMRCPSCEGTGQRRMVRQTLLGQMVTATTCPACGGAGLHIPTPCRACRGEGRTVENRTLTVKVPPGVDTGSTLRIRGRGAVGARGGAPGDLYVHFRVAAHDTFRRDGDDLVLDLHISPAQAVLGARIPVVLLDGEEEIRVPAGTQPGTVVTFRSRGVPRLQGRGRGDLLVRIVVDIPTEPDAGEAELYRQLAEVRGDSIDESGGGLLSRLRSAFK